MGSLASIVDNFQGGAVFLRNLWYNLAKLKNKIKKDE